MKFFWSVNHFYCGEGLHLQWELDKPFILLWITTLFPKIKVYSIPTSLTQILFMTCQSCSYLKILMKKTLKSLCFLQKQWFPVKILWWLVYYLIPLVLWMLHLEISLVNLIWLNIYYAWFEVRYYIHMQLQQFITDTNSSKNVYKYKLIWKWYMGLQQ